MFLCAICDRPRHHHDHGYFLTPAGDTCEDCWQEMGEDYDDLAAGDVAAYEARQYELAYPQQDVGMGSYPCEVESLLAEECVSCGRLLTPDTGSTMGRCDCCYQSQFK